VLSFSIAFISSLLVEDPFRKACNTQYEWLLRCWTAKSMQTSKLHYINFHQCKNTNNTNHINSSSVDLVPSRISISVFIF
jgi:hypothetical protein